MQITIIQMKNNENPIQKKRLSKSKKCLIKTNANINVIKSKWKKNVMQFLLIKYDTIQMHKTDIILVKKINDVIQMQINEMIKV